MYINKGKRDILIFPKFENINKLQELRNKYDPLANLIAPHITIVFPFSDNISNEELIKKITNLLKDFKPFTIVFKGISLSQDNYIFLNCIQGNQEIIELHNEIYKQIITSHSKKSSKYIPHITLGRSNDIHELDSFDYEFKTVEGKNAHELVLYYEIDLADKDYKEEYIVNDDNGQSKATWININDFKNGNKILYPEEVFKYL